MPWIDLSRMKQRMLRCNFKNVWIILFAYMKSRLKRSRLHVLSVNNVMPRIGLEKKPDIFRMLSRFYVFLDLPIERSPSSYNKYSLVSFYTKFFRITLAPETFSPTTFESDSAGLLQKSHITTPTPSTRFSINNTNTTNDIYILYNTWIHLLFVLTARSKVHWKRYYSITPMLPIKRSACIASILTEYIRHFIRAYLNIDIYYPLIEVKNWKFLFLRKNIRYVRQRYSCAILEN